MKINNTDISAYGAKQWNFTYEHSSVANESEWATGAALPYLQKNRIGFSSFTVSLMMKESAGRAAIRRNCSDILSLLINPVTLTLDGFDTKFRAVLTSHSEEERSIRQYHLLKLTFVGYEFGDDVTGAGTGEVTINNPGNIPCRGVISVTPSVDGDIILDGLIDSILIEDCAAGVTLTINGMTGIIMQGTTPKGADVTMWTLPEFIPGENRVVCSDENAILSITITPLYM